MLNICLNMEHGMQEYLNSLGDELVWPSQSGDCFDNSFFLQGGPAAVTSTTAQVQPAKLRLRWTPQLHSEFLRACHFLGGPDKATPKQILMHMGVQGLSLFHVKSHLQKYRQALKSLDHPPGGTGPAIAPTRKRGTPSFTGEHSDSGTLEGDSCTQDAKEGAYPGSGQLGSPGVHPSKQKGQGQEGSTTWKRRWAPGARPEGPGNGDSSSTSPRGASPSGAQHAQHTPSSSVGGAEGKVGISPAVDQQGFGGAEVGGGAGAPPAVLPAQQDLPSGSSDSADVAFHFQEGGDVRGAAGGQAQRAQQGEQVQGAAGRSGEMERERSRRMQEALAVQRELQQQLQDALEAQRALQTRLMAHGEFIQRLIQQGDQAKGQPPPSSPTPTTSARASRQKRGGKQLHPPKRPASATKPPMRRAAAAAAGPTRTLVLHLHQDPSAASLAQSASTPPCAARWRMAGRHTGGEWGTSGTSPMNVERGEMLSSPFAGTPPDLSQREPSAASTRAHALLPPAHAHTVPQEWSPSVPSLQSSLTLPQDVQESSRAPPAGVSGMLPGKLHGQPAALPQESNPGGLEHGTAQHAQQGVPPPTSALRLWRPMQQPAWSPQCQGQLQDSFQTGSPAARLQRSMTDGGAHPSLPSHERWYPHSHAQISHRADPVLRCQEAGAGVVNTAGVPHSAQSAPSPPTASTDPGCPLPEDLDALCPSWLDLALAHLPDSFQGTPRDQMLGGSTLDPSLSDIFEDPTLLEGCPLP